MQGGDNAGLIAYFLDELWNKQNLAVIDQLTVQDYVVHVPQGDLIGREAFRTVVTRYFERFGIDLIIVNQTGQDSQIVTFLGWDTVLNFDVMQPLALGLQIQRKIPTRGVSIDRIDNGQIAESWNMLDTLYWLFNAQELSKHPIYAEILPTVTTCSLKNPCPLGYHCVNAHCVQDSGSG